MIGPDPMKYLQTRLDLYVTSPDLRIVTQGWVLNDERFVNGYGSDTKHHNYRGALPWHTAEVLYGALAAASAYPAVDLEVLTLACIWHDIAKIYDYDKDGQATDYKSKIYHVAGSYTKWMQATCKHFSVTRVDAVGHCILAHHGRREWKACVEPQTIEAFLLHHADLLSAWYGPSRLAPPVPREDLVDATPA